MAEVQKETFDTNIAVGEYGTQFFHFNAVSKKFEYALPLVSGGEYGGDTETFDAPEMDLDYVAKISGRTSLNEVKLISNYTKDRHARWLEILNNKEAQSYLEVYADGSASAYSGTAGRPTITGGDVRQINVTIAPENLIWIADVNNVDEETFTQLKDMLGLDASWSANYKIPFDETTIPNKRVQFFEGTDSTV